MNGSHITATCQHLRHLLHAVAVGLQYVGFVVVTEVGEDVECACIHKNNLHTIFTGVKQRNISHCIGIAVSIRQCSRILNVAREKFGGIVCRLVIKHIHRCGKHGGIEHNALLQRHLTGIRSWNGAPGLATGRTTPRTLRACHLWHSHISTKRRIPDCFVDFVHLLDTSKQQP